MFRKMRRFKQELSRDDCLSLLKNEPRGVLSVLGDDGYPYGLPMSFLFDESCGKIYFHCARVGHKIDAIKNSDKVSFCIMDKGFRRNGEWALNIKSVIVFGRIRVVEDRAETVKICAALARKFTDDEAYIASEIEHSSSSVICLELTPEHISGKLVNES